MTKVEKVPIISALSSLGLMLFQVFMASISGSIALLADAWHSGSDMVSAVFVFLSLRLSRRFEDRSEKIKKIGITVENVIAGLVGLLIIYAAYEIFRKAFGGGAQVVTKLW